MGFSHRALGVNVDIPGQFQRYIDFLNHMYNCNHNEHSRELTAIDMSSFTFFKLTLPSCCNHV